MRPILIFITTLVYVPHIKCLIACFWFFWFYTKKARQSFNHIKMMMM